MIPLIKPEIDFDEVSDDIRGILSSGWLTAGRYVREFEERFARYVGAEHALTMTSATTALHIALVARDIGPGDEVLVSDFSFPASGNAIVQTGATPVLVDCRAGGFDIDWDDALAKVGPKTRALMLVHPFGQPPHEDAMAHFRAASGVWILEDAACAIASRGREQLCGALGDAAAFSFHPRKILTTGEGGMLTTSDSALAQRLGVLRTHGGRPGGVGLEFIENGFNYRMSEIQAALGLAQLKRIDAVVEERRRVGAVYLERLAGHSLIEVPLTAAPERCSFQSFVVLLSPEIERNEVVAQMRVRGIETTLGTYAMHSQPAFERFGYRAGDLPHSYRAQQSSLTLPLLAGMREEQIDTVVKALLEACDASRLEAAEQGL